MPEELADGPVVATLTWWYGPKWSGSLMCEGVFSLNGTLYAEFHDGWNDAHDRPEVVLVPVVTLLRDYRAAGYKYDDGYE